MQRWARAASGRVPRGLAGSSEGKVAKASATVMPHLSNDELETLRMVLSGWHTWTPEQMHQLRDLDGGLRPLSLLDYWKDTIK